MAFLNKLAHLDGQGYLKCISLIYIKWIFFPSFIIIHLVFVFFWITSRLLGLLLNAGVEGGGERAKKEPYFLVYIIFFLQSTMIFIVWIFWQFGQFINVSNYLEPREVQCLGLADKSIHQHL